MIDISENISNIRKAKYGIEVRGSIANGLEAIQNEANLLASQKLDVLTTKGPNLYNPDRITEGKKQLTSVPEDDSEYFITEKIQINTAKNYIKFGYAGEDGTLVKATYAYCALFYNNDVIDLRSGGNGVTILKNGEVAAYFVATFSNEMKDKQLYIAYGDKDEDITGQEYIAYEAVNISEKIDESVVTAQIAQSTAAEAKTTAENALQSAQIATETVEEAAATATEQANIATQKATEIAESAEQIGTNTNDIDTLKGDLNEINDLFSNMLQITQTANLLNPDTLEYGKTINSSGNVVDTSQNKAVSEQIKVDNSLPLKITTNYAQALYQYRDDGTLITYTTAFSSSESLTLDAETTFVRIVVWVSRLPFMLYQSNDDLTYVDFGIYSKSVRKIINIYVTDTEEEILDKMYSAYNAGNCDVCWEYGTYEFDSAFELVKIKYGRGTAYELPIGGNCRYYFNGATIQGTYTGEDTNVRGNCSVLGSWRGSGSYELYDGIIEATGIVYCVHDEAQSSEIPYLRKYHNMRMKFISVDTYTNTLSKCIGGGTGLRGMVEIENCYFESDNGENPEVSYHGHSKEDETIFRISILNSYFGHSFGAHALATNETAELIFSGNSVLSIPTENTGKWTIKAWNNEVRS